MEELKIRPIRNGTVVDHIPRGQALNVLRVLGVDSSTRDV
ncbi:MAG: aspartate carbamoyltransferase regulatory subunit, partial [Halobacteriales archaeon]